MDDPTYRKAGVDIDAGNAFVRRIKPLVSLTHRPGVLGSIGGFGGFFSIEQGKYKDAVLVSGTDGVGTKLKVAFLANRHDTIGIDLVAMCVNDVAVTGAEPLFFLDYLAAGKLDSERDIAIIRGIVEGCRRAGCALIGGETAEMPSMYSSGEYDLAGFAVGIIERSEIVDGMGIREGDGVIGVASSGLHSNGYSLARNILLERSGLDIGAMLPECGRPVGEELLEPTLIYVEVIKRLLSNCRPKGMAHITGGGLTENIPRVLPDNTGVQIRRGSWTVPAIFEVLSSRGPVSLDEMFRDFNMGIGLVLITGPENVEETLQHIATSGHKGWIIGEVIRGSCGVRYV
jgi:phosphoribosylformylglycinamidine cyclo-ligase